MFPRKHISTSKIAEIIPRHIKTDSVNISTLLEYKHIIQTFQNNPDACYLHNRINEVPITTNTISIVMTSANRSRQTYYTLNSFVRSNYKDIQVILVDDSSSDPIDIRELNKFPFTIDFIRILREKKWWSNPCVTYNIGFQFVKGGSVILQNAEVFHVGDVIEFVHNNIHLDHRYFVFDVRQSASYETNEMIYKANVQHTTDIYLQNEYFDQSGRYQSARHNNRALHFLSAMPRSVFDKLGGFSYDYAFGTWYDDDDLLLKVKCLHVTIISLDNADVKCGGVHQFHTLAGFAWGKDIPFNDEIYKSKIQHFNKTGTYLEIV